MGEESWQFSQSEAAGCQQASPDSVFEALLSGGHLAGFGTVGSLRAFTRVRVCPPQAMNVTAGTGEVKQTRMAYLTASTSKEAHRGQSVRDQKPRFAYKCRVQSNDSRGIWQKQRDSLSEPPRTQRAHSRLFVIPF